MTSLIPPVVDVEGGVAVDVDGGVASLDLRLDFFFEAELEGLFCLEAV